MERAPAVEGMFYPASKQELEGQLKAFAVSSAPRGDVHGIIVPHAGYIYSGFTAAHGYSLLKGQRYDLIVLLGPSHHFGYRGVTQDGHDAWRTPLGSSRIDYALLGNGLATSNDAHAPEHSLEVQVPFLQHYGIAGPLAPLLVGMVSDAEARRLAELLAEAAKRHRVLFVVSSDLSHYLPRDECRRHDDKSITTIEQLDTAHWDAIDACGRYPLRIIMHLCRQMGWTPRLVHKSDSGDAGGSIRSVVGYAALSF